MLSGEHRLRSSRDIQDVVKRGKRVHTPLATLFMRASGAEHSRVACVAGKKISNRAPDRHRIQRLLRAVAAEVLPNLTDSYDMVWVARPEIANVESMHEVRDVIIPQLRKEGFFKAEY